MKLRTVIFIASLTLMSCKTQKATKTQTINKTPSAKNQSQEATNSIDLEEATFMKHIVKNGETLCTIAKRYGVTINSLISANKITNPDLIVIGQEILIPNKEDSLSEN